MPIAPSKTKEQANYRPGTSARHCGNCDMYHDHRCTLVKGVISPRMVCKYWEEKD